MREQIIKILKSKIRTAQIADDIEPHVINAEEVANEICALPSGAGAAEPVAWRWRPRGSVNWIYDPHPGWFAEHKDEIDHEPLYATPVQSTARPDREAFYTILKKYYAQDATLDAAWQELKEAAGVQPGAGERE